MKILIILSAAFLAVNALSIEPQWNQFKITYNKRYETSEEEQLRFNIYQDNLEKINRHNRRYEAGLETYTMTANKFADLTQTEFGDMLRSQSGSLPEFEFEKRPSDEPTPIPDSIDWRETDKAVLPVKDQNYTGCNSGWAFSATGALEGQNAIKNNARTPLSEQQLIDCDEASQGCDGGSVANAIQYVIKNGLTSETDYPYLGNQTICQAQNTTITAKALVTLDKTEADLQQAVGSVGPISAGMYFDLLQFYEGGIFHSDFCFNEEAILDHDVLVVGYGSEYSEELKEERKYWIIKNSMGQDWGEKGYVRLARDADQCGIALRCSYPIL
ncbi:unnamed protein product [Phyllotreta striolata]|uniref:Uncharacterized protein n=1 Tax=Phyllotreta striolata TaxID=444603 RepID=A0A9N9XQA3_PHYSR|nr:unnamed protein product [Phyllotreta striolata]